MTILLPTKSYGYYMNYPFGINKDIILNKYIGFQEYEILLPRNSIFKIIETRNTNNIFFIKLLLTFQMKLTDLVNININKNDMPPYILKLEDIDKTMYLEVKYNKKNIPVNNIKFDLYTEYLKNNIFHKYYLFILRNLLNIPNKDLSNWLKLKPKYNSKYNISKEKYDKTYNDFIDLTSKMKKIKNVYISGKYLMDNNDNYKDLLDIYKGKIIKIKKPLLFSKKLNSAFIGDSDIFICKDDNSSNNNTNTMTIDQSYPYLIIIKYTSLFSYIPTSTYNGFTFDITRMKIDKIQKIRLYDNTFCYYISAS